MAAPAVPGSESDSGSSKPGTTPATPASAPVAAPSAPAPALTPEEQMALFEKELKENDWGHQPC